ADVLDLAGPSDRVRRGRGPSDLAAERLGDDERAGGGEVEAVRRLPGRRNRRLSLRIAAFVHGVRAELIGTSLSHHERRAVRAEGDLRAVGRVAAQRPLRVGDRLELLARDPESVDGRGAVVEDVDETVAYGDARRPRAAGRDRVREAQPVVLGREQGYVVATCVHDEQVPV